MARRRTQLCTFCKKHSIRIGIKNHTRNCSYKTCNCLCCQETRICQRFNRANTKNSRKTVGERSLTLPAELIEMFGFEKELLGVIGGFRSLCGLDEEKFKAFMWKWIEKGFGIVRQSQDLIKCGLGGDFGGSQAQNGSFETIADVAHAKHGHSMFSMEIRHYGCEYQASGLGTLNVIAGDDLIPQELELFTDQCDHNQALDDDSLQNGINITELKPINSNQWNSYGINSPCLPEFQAIFENL